VEPATPGSKDVLAPPPARTPTSIYLGLALFAFAIATPFLGDLDARHAQGDGGWATLRVMLKWMLMGGASALLGIVCVIIGARRGPNTPLTMIAILLAGIAGVGFRALLGMALG
jgi:hypothetical protein